jgi:hypothetical protein
MIEITNLKKHPVQLVVRSQGELRSFRTLNIPGIGKGKNVVLIEDERETECIDRVKKLGWISVRHVNNKNMGE